MQMWGPENTLIVVVQGLFEICFCILILAINYL